MANVLVYAILIGEFEHQSCYYIHFQTNILRKGMNPFPSSYELNSTTTVLLKDDIN